MLGIQRIDEHQRAARVKIEPVRDSKQTTQGENRDKTSTDHEQTLARATRTLVLQHHPIIQHLTHPHLQFFLLEETFR